MTWVTDDGLHEGYAAYITVDGREARGTRSEGLIMGYGAALDGSSDQIVDWNQLLGWEARCDCQSPASGRTIATWIGPLWRSFANANDPEELPYLDGTVADAIHTAWEQHLQMVGARA